MKRAVLVVVAATAVVTVLAFTVSPISPQTAWAAFTASAIKEGRNTAAPRTGAKALKILRVDVMKMASDYRHKRYRAVCADMTKKERQHLGGTSQCMMKMAVLNAYVPIKKFTIKSVKLARKNAQVTVSLYVNGKKSQLVHAVVKWEGGRYRLDHQSGWHPTF